GAIVDRPTPSKHSWTPARQPQVFHSPLATTKSTSYCANRETKPHQHSGTLGTPGTPGTLGHSSLFCSGGRRSRGIPDFSSSVLNPSGTLKRSAGGSERSM